MQRTTEDLREILFTAIDDVSSGKIEPKQAKEIANLATKIINSAELELKYSSVVSILDKQGQGISPGRLLLTQAAITD